MKPENAIEVNHISKKFKVYMDKGHTLKEKMLFSKRRKYEERIVLDDISFEVKKGEAIGLIGQNGCGKSTTLKLLTRIMYPDSGNIEMCGRVSSLIELGAGFHPDMSGRQNIYTNASIFGLTRKEIEARFNDIVAFSELEQFIDNPVRTYSSGMYMRLAFSVAINVDADILLIDEILAVGDANFQAKCFNKLRELKANGTTIVIVSHSLGQVEQICERSIWILGGKLQAIGIPRDIHPMYLDFMGQARQDSVEEERQREKANEVQAVQDPLKVEAHNHSESFSPESQSKRWGNGNARISTIRVLDGSMKEKAVFSTGDKVVISISYELYKEVDDVSFGIGIYRSDGQHCYGTNTKVEKFEHFNINHSGKVNITFEHIELLPGSYCIDIAIEAGLGLPIDYFTKACSFEIYSNIDDIGISRLKHTWEFCCVER
ncbi:MULTISPECIES: ABC transporter ATP-binding protein [Hungatella]|uniref:ATP-binding cassette domain-containing protein n=1 Tax=Hungatella hathewayi TaxID=154046 RepID=A0AAW9WEV0_9FIRM|nr:MULTISPECIES: ABC transporter ATP-binding protein [Hungatella]MCQ4828788.1 ABC transporter ATP-binding protein [Hungatella sp. SL.1.14]MUB63860.1 ATP-binding cassette domain-containing protein [Hungatella hathewayi]CUQ41592.1 O-antigen export system ATP-binding protein RfbB [Hungatella hathewayi]